MSNIQHYAIEEARLIASFDDRQRYAREEFAHWRENHPNFTSRELLDHWRQIRRAWNLSQPDKPRKR